jgi:hypothetical protein
VTSSRTSCSKRYTTALNTTQFSENWLNQSTLGVDVHDVTQHVQCTEHMCTVDVCKCCFVCHPV